MGPHLVTTKARTVAISRRVPAVLAAALVACGSIELSIYLPHIPAVIAGIVLLVWRLSR